MIQVNSSIIILIAILIFVYIAINRITRIKKAGLLADIIGLLNVEIERLYNWYVTNKGLYTAIVYNGNLTDQQYKKILQQCADFIYSNLSKGIKTLALQELMTKQQLLTYIIVYIDSSMSKSFLTNTPNTEVNK